MDTALHQRLRQQVHQAAREITRALTAHDLAICQAALARAEAELQAVAAALHGTGPEAGRSTATFDDIEVQGRALRQQAERLAAELYVRRPSTTRRLASQRIAVYLLAAAGLLLVSMTVGEWRRWWQPEGLVVTYFQDVNLTQPGWRTYALAVLVEPADRPVPRWFGRGDFASRWTGWLDVPQTTNYAFQCQSRDGLRLFLDGRCVVDNWRDQTWEESLRTVALHLTNGLHALQVEHYDRRRKGAVLCIRWSGGGIPTNTILAVPYLRKRP